MKSNVFALFVAVFVSFLAACSGDNDNTPPFSSPLGSTWKDATLVFDNTPSLPQLGADDDGNVIAVWRLSDGLYASHYKVGSGWGTPLMIAAGSIPAPYLTNLHLAVNARGDAVAVWVHEEFNNYFIESVRYIAGSGWENSQKLAISSNVFSLDLALDVNSNAAIVWEGSETTIRRIFASRLLKSSQWDPPQQISTSTWDTQLPRVAVDDSGNALALWAEGQYGPNQVYASRYSANTGWEGPQQIASDAGAAAWTNISFDGSGNAMAVWGQSDSNSHHRIYSCRYVAGSGWNSVGVIDSSPLDSKEPALTVDRDGNFSAVWVQMNGTGLDVYGSRYTVSNGWGVPVLIGTGGNAVSPRVAADGAGNIFATWQQYDLDTPYSGDRNVYVNRYAAGSGWGTQRQLKNTLGSAQMSELAVNRQGFATVMWTQSVGYIPGTNDIKYGIFAARFD